jgi:hypothetical protein
MPDRYQVNAAAASLSKLPNSPEFRQGVEMLRHACASNFTTFPEEAEAFAVGLLAGAKNPETQLGIMALAAMLRVNPDALLSVAYSLRMCSPELQETQRVMLIEANGQQVTQ